jgi:hypothetical protein
MKNDILLKTLDDLRVRKRHATCALEDLEQKIQMGKKELEKINTLINLVEREIENNLKQ